MTLEELCAWLEQHGDRITMFMDYQVRLDDEAGLASTLGYWFGSDAWQTDGMHFVHLGTDGTGGPFAAWIREGIEDIPVVQFGSEGGRGVVAKSCADWAKIIAHAPGVREYGTDDLVELDERSNWMLDENENDPEDIAASRAALEAYRDAVEVRFGVLPAFEELTADLASEARTFAAWVEEVLGSIPDPLETSAS